MAQMPFPDSLFRSDPALESCLSRLRDSASIAILYSSVDRAANGMPVINTFRWHSDSLRFFCSEPVHLPMAILALNKMSGYRTAGIDKSTTMITEAENEDQSPAYNDPRWPGGRPSLERYITNMLLLHEESSFNRVYEFLGQAWIQQEFFKRGYRIRYSGRLEEESDEASRRTNPIVFYDERLKPVYRQETAYNPSDYPVFKGETAGAYKNLLELESLHHLFTGLIYPERVNASERFELTREDRLFLLTNISRLREETLYPYHDTASVDDNAFFNAIMPGREGVRVFNTGGFTGKEILESAFIIDTARGVEFIITAAIRVENEQTLDLAFDFLSMLGESVLRYDAARPRAIKPDLSSFILSYDR